MCLYPKRILNPKYKPNKKNGGVPPICKDRRLLYIETKCGQCLECRQQKKREWITRLTEELKHNPKAWFMTLTISPEEMKKLSEKYNLKEPNEIASKAHRMYLELIRKHTKKAPRHWSITELGEEKGRIHLHGIFWGDINILKSCWKFGFVFVGTFVNEKTINYITKYMLKQNPYDIHFKGKVLCSKGIGAGYKDSINAKLINKYNGKDTKEYYLLRNGQKTALPAYYKQKLWTDEEREQLRLYKDEKNETYIMGEKCNSDDSETIYNLRQFYRKQSEEILKYNHKIWEKEKDERKSRKKYYVRKIERIIAEKIQEEKRRALREADAAFWEYYEMRE